MAQVVITAAAQEDEREAVLFKMERSTRRATELVDALDALYKRLAQFPATYPEVKPSLRRAVLPGLDYSVFYRVEQEVVYVLRLLHARSDPDRWPNG